MSNLLFSFVFLQVGLDLGADFIQLGEFLSCIKLCAVLSVPKKLLLFPLRLSCACTLFLIISCS